MARVIRSPRAKCDIVETLEYTTERWGVAQAREYADLIQDGLASIAGDPERGKPRDDVRPSIRALHIKQRPARHILFYRINSAGTVEVVRFLHDAMDFVRHLP
jgi:plasmid stabilization system protein ParE